MTMTYGTDEGFNEPGTPGFTNPFQYENLLSPPYRRFAKNRRAGLANATLEWEPTQNDILFAHRNVYTSRFQAPSTRNPRLLAAFHPGGGQSYESSDVPMSIRRATGVILDSTGKAIASPGDLSRGPLGAMSSAAGLVSVNLGTGRSNDIFAQWLTMSDADVTTVTQHVARVTDANNWIGLSRQAATNLRVTRNVAGTPATERDITIPTTTPATGNAFGLRLSGTTAQVFLNGVKLDDWTLNAAAQALTGTLMGVVLPAGTHVYSPISYFEAWSTTPVLGV